MRPWARRPQLKRDPLGRTHAALQGMMSKHGWPILLIAMAACRADRPATADPGRDSSPHTVQMVAVAPGVSLEVLDWGGTGRPLVLLAGLHNTAHVFDDFALSFSDSFHVYAVKIGRAHV